MLTSASHDLAGMPRLTAFAAQFLLFPTCLNASAHGSPVPGILDLNQMRCLVVADLHYSCRSSTGCRRRQIRRRHFCVDALDIGSFCSRSDLVVKKYLSLLSRTRW
jgi:hypothetical protein